MAKKPPDVTVNVPPDTGGKGKQSKYAQYINYWRAHGYKAALTPNLVTAMQQAAAYAHIDPVVFAGLILSESSGNPNAISNAGAIGLGQLMPSSFVGQPVPWNPHQKITEKMLHDPGFNLRLSALYLGKLQGDYPTDYIGRYKVGPNGDVGQISAYNQGFFQHWVAKWDPKYVSPVASTSPPSPAGQQVPGGTGQPATDIPFKDPYVAGINKHNKFVTTMDPNKALQYNGAPLTRSSFLTLRDSLSSHYVSYTGKRPSNHQIQNFLKAGWSTYTLDNLLSKSPAFDHSPIKKQYETNYKAAVQNLLPKGAKIPEELLRQAIVNNWTSDAVAAKLRQTPGYLKSNEFHGNVASMLNIHTAIMGNPAPTAMIGIKDAALAGWTADQYAAWLRSQPAYTSSPEYQTKALGFLQGIGMITGDQVVLQPGVGPGPGAVGKSVGPLPSDKRVPGKPVVNSVSDLGATLSLMGTHVAPSAPL